ncbi:MAG TPA: hypothetical protein VEQ85_00475 [Lacipirellulaceae bacterium]|nr:hypothetical protein [Lacipirellulaceae bacterium]
MQSSGRLLVIGTFAVGLLMAGGAWWYNYSQTRRAADFWGAGDAMLLIGGPRVELLTLEPPAAAPGNASASPPPEGQAEEGHGQEGHAQEGGAREGHAQDGQAQERQAQEGHAREGLIAGRRPARAFELTGKPGLVHMRHALTYDANFDWAGATQEQLPARPDWSYALRFTGPRGALVVLAPADFTRIGRVADGGGAVDVVPCPQLGPVLLKYLQQPDVGALPADPR